MPVIFIKMVPLAIKAIKYAIPLLSVNNVLPKTESRKGRTNPKAVPQ